MLLEEFDSNRNAVINAFDLIEPIQNFPQIAVSCFSRITFDRLLNELNGVPIASTGVANMEIPIYRVSYNGIEIALFMSYVGAAGCVAVLEDLFAMGVEKIVLFGTCGVLDADIKDCSIIIPNVAVRDEGTSFHYAAASDEINVNVKHQEEFIEILKSHKCSYTVGKVWTTDGIYRETREKVNKRKKDGCICVDMECSAVAALADFRGKEIFHFFYAADNLDNDNWDIRSLANSSNVLEKDRIALLAMELAAKILQVISHIRLNDIHIKPKRDAVIVVGGGDGTIDKPYDTACCLLHHMNAYDISQVVYCFNTNNKPAIEGEVALAGVNNIIRFLMAVNLYY